MVPSGPRFQETSSTRPASNRSLTKLKSDEFRECDHRRVMRRRRVPIYANYAAADEVKLVQSSCNTIYFVSKRRNFEYRERERERDSRVYQALVTSDQTVYNITRLLFESPDRY